MKLRVGDIIQHEDDRAFVCEILEVRATGFSYRYVLRADRRTPNESDPLIDAYRSEQGDDPFFDGGWSRMDWAAAD